MTAIPISLAVEDVLSEAVLRRLLAASGRAYAVGPVYCRGGNGYLKKTIHGWNKAAQGIPFLLVTDLDSNACPSQLIASWLSEPKHQNLLFRIAVREIEAWLLSDAKGLASFLAIKPMLVPTDPESLPDPKRTLIELAAQSRRKGIREDIVPSKGSTSKIGPGYNLTLTDFVQNHWDAATAATRSRSLQRTLDRLATFQPVWEG